MSTARMGALVIAWWFITTSSNGYGTTTATHGPFQSWPQCNQTKEWLSKAGTGSRAEASPCWWDGRT